MHVSGRVRDAAEAEVLEISIPGVRHPTFTNIKVLKQAKMYVLQGDNHMQVERL